MFGLQVTLPAVVFIDNQSVVVSATMPSSALKKKHLAVSWHKIREVVAIKAAVVAHVKSQFNLADGGSKPLGPHALYRLIREILYGQLYKN